MEVRVMDVPSALLASSSWTLGQGIADSLLPVLDQLL
jgi:hypothetical protein